MFYLKKSGGTQQKINPQGFVKTIRERRYWLGWHVFLHS